MKSFLTSSCLLLLTACGSSEEPEGTSDSSSDSRESSDSPSMNGAPPAGERAAEGETGAGNEGEGGDSDSTEAGGADTPDGSSGSPSEPLLTDMRSFLFGHSLLVHATSEPVTPNETTVPHWMAQFAEASGYTYRADGQYGFLSQHSQLPPNPQWGFAEVQGVWNTDSGQSFREAGFNNVVLTAANFVQYQPPTAPYDGDNPAQNTPVSETLKIVDWVQEQDPDIDIYIYENWPDMAGFIESFPPTPTELSEYYAFTQGDFHAWWLDYQDAVRAARPDANVRMLPVGPILFKLFTDTNLANIPVGDLYEDDAPHGRPTLYFLASLVTFMGTYGTQPQSNFVPPASIHAEVRDHLSETMQFIWDELDRFEDDNEESRVWGAP